MTRKKTGVERNYRWFSEEEDEKIQEMRIGGAGFTEIGVAIGRRRQSVAYRLEFLARRDEDGEDPENWGLCM